MGLHPSILVASVIAAFLGVVGVLLTTMVVEPPANMYITPDSEVRIVGETVVVNITIESTVPVNVFGGELRFDNDILKVESIDYNTSIADLWAELPWFSNGEGTLNFGGGTTRPGGFTGRGDLLTVTFKALKPGDGELTIVRPRILQHDGAGTDVELRDTIETVVRVDEVPQKENLITVDNVTKKVSVTPEKATTDLNGDGLQTLADVSIFILNAPSKESRFDFNQDGQVNTKDLAILLSL